MDYSNRFLLSLRYIGQRVGILRPFVRIYRKAMSVGYEESFDRVIINQITPGDIVWDVGANVGFFTGKFATATGSAGQVVAFEPSPGTFAELQKSFGCLQNVRLENIALADFDGEADFHIMSDGTNPTNGLFSTKSDAVTKVKVFKGSTFVGDHPELTPNKIKIDVEGFEYEVISGLSEILKSNLLRSVFVEVHFSVLRQRGLPDIPAKIMETLKEYGFQIKWVDASHIVASR